MGRIWIRSSQLARRLLLELYVVYLEGPGADLECKCRPFRFVNEMRTTARPQMRLGYHS